MLARGEDGVEIVTRGYGRAGQAKQHLGQRIGDRPEFALVGETEKMLEQHGQPRWTRASCLLQPGPHPILKFRLGVLPVTAAEIIPIEPDSG